MGFKKNSLPLFVLIMGVCGMAVEMALSRLFAPYFGASLFIWGAIIGTVLVALSLGYYFGGKRAGAISRTDSVRASRDLSVRKIAILGSVLIAAAVMVFDLIFSAYREKIFLAESPVLIIFLLIISLLLFFAPVFFLGMVCPLAVAVIDSAGKKPETAGKIFSFSTIGSIIGVFIPSFLTIPYFGTRETLYGCAFLGLLAGLVFLKGKKVFWLLLIIPAAGYFLSLFLNRALENDLIVKESPYQFIKVKENEGRKELLTDSGVGLQSVYEPSKEVLGEYWDDFAVFPYLQDLKRRERSVLMLGMAGGTIPRQLRNLTGKDFDYQITGVELDPDLKKIAREEFDSREETVESDARVYLKSHPQKKDLIFVDVYDELFIPFHLASREFFNLVLSRLGHEGIVVVNINSPHEETKYFKSLCATFAIDFPFAYVMHVNEAWNYLLIGSGKEVDFDKVFTLPNEKLASLKPYFHNVLDLKKDQDLAAEKPEIFTDNRSAIEPLTVRMYFEAMGKKARQES